MNTLAEYMDYINAHREQVLGNLDQESIDAYVFLSRRFHECDVSNDMLFQSRFRTFYRLDSAGLTKEFKTEFFLMLQARRGANPVDLRILVDHFYLIPRIKGDNTLQFSFVTKLAHTINPSYPIYDNEVANAFAFRWPVYGSFEHRLDRLLGFYEWLRSAYATILLGNLMSQTAQGFRTKFPEQNPYIPDIKVLDFLFWSTGKLIRTRQLVDVPNHVFEPARRPRNFRPAQ